MTGRQHIPPPVGEDDVQAYIDGRLDGPREADVKSWLAAHPAQAEAVDAHRRILASLRVEADALLEPIPADLRVRELRERKQGRTRTRMPYAAAAVVLLAIGGASGWAIRSSFEPLSTAGTMADATAAWRIFANDAVQPVELPADKRVQLAAWVGSHIGRAIDIPDLSGAGLRFLGGRLLSADAGPAGMFLYEDSGKRRFIFYVRATSGERPEGLQVRVSNGVETRFWFDGRHGYAFAGPSGLAAATEAVRKLYSQAGRQGN